MPLKHHPAAALFPRMSDNDFDDLVADIEKNGQLDPIIVYQDQIIDGRHRHAACRRLKLKPKFVEWKGTGSPVDFVLARNLVRRHLSVSQRTAIACEAEALFSKEAKEAQREGGRKGGKVPRKTEEAVAEDLLSKQEELEREAAARAAKACNVSRSQVYALSKVRDADATLIPLVKKGHVNVSVAGKLARLDKKQRAEVLRRGEEEGDIKKAFKGWLTENLGQQLLQDALDKLERRYASICRVHIDLFGRVSEYEVGAFTLSADLERYLQMLGEYLDRIRGYCPFTDGDGGDVEGPADEGDAEETDYGDEETGNEDTDYGYEEIGNEETDYGDEETYDIEGAADDS